VGIKTNDQVGQNFQTEMGLDKKSLITYLIQYSCRHIGDPNQ
jgi:hypothetical protein